jgi:hypothetical protein
MEIVNFGTSIGSTFDFACRYGFNLLILTKIQLKNHIQGIVISIGLFNIKPMVY